ncbi:TRAP transporter small permease [Amorphus orientalis]|uniref:TRAP transporter small permease protein n=1 Tax=Amorphus orientalis TaxID=649198 RepID=A0AAE4ASM7_9HYPH|nr:TRAP transporter small permease [Amorphus orientalis]MDQ0315195.1 TRAP-type C4-dicarboxylate transport system permease small subunit [Amorphus orientalis]
MSGTGTQMASRRRSGLDRIGRAAEFVGVAAYVAIFATFILQIVVRYVFRSPLGWPDEMIATLFVWVVFWGGAFMVPYRKQIAFDLLYRAFPPRLRLISDCVTLLVTAGLFLAALPVTADYIVFADRMKTPVLDIPMSWVYAPMALFLLATAIRMLLEARRVLTEAR